MQFTEDTIVLKSVLRRIRDNEDGPVFDGDIRNGVIDGVYSSFVLRSTHKGYIMSTLRVRGFYDLDQGHLEIRLRKSVVFFVMVGFALAFLVVGILVEFVWKDVEIPGVVLIAFGFMYGAITVGAHRIEMKRFKKYLNRIFKEVRGEL